MSQQLAATFDPFDRSLNFTLSGGNLTAQNTGASSVENVAVCTPRLKGFGSSYLNSYILAAWGGGMYYWEWNPAVIFNPSSTYSNIGVVAAGFAPQGNYPGNSNNGVGYYPNGAVYFNGSSVATIQTYAAGNNIGIALDMVNGLIYFRVNGGNWNNSGTANPATQTGGISISTLANLTFPWWSPAYYSYANGDEGTINLGGSAFAYTPPSGFVSPESVWDLAATETTFSRPAIEVAASPGAVVSPTAGFCPVMFSGAQQFVSGIVEENSSPVAGKIVRLYDNKTGQLLGATTSGAGGAYLLPAMGSPDVDVVALDQVTYQAQIYDDVTPG